MSRETLESRREAARQRAVVRLTSHPWPAGLLSILERLRGDGGEALLVGGTVRDVLLGRESDPLFDVATDRTPEQVRARFARVEPIGIEHGTVLILEEGVRVECTTLRREGGYADARHPDRVEFTRDPIEDLGRRDLTINALAFDPAAGALLDPHGGVLDLELGTLRAVGDPLARFREDALRPLRVARFSATLEMQPEPATRASLGGVLDRARRVAWERVRDELVKMMAAPRPSVGLELLREAGLLELWLPELAHCDGVPQNRFHAYDVYRHSLATCDAAPRSAPRVRWAALLHDVGKPATRVDREGEGTFYNHQFVGAELADRALERLRFPLEERRAIVHLVREHMFHYESAWSDAALRRWLARVRLEALDELFALRAADFAGNGLKSGDSAELGEMRRRIERLLEESRVLRVRDLEIGGDDVMRVLAIEPGPRVGEILEGLLAEVLERPALNRRERLLERLAQLRDHGS